MVDDRVEALSMTITEVDGAESESAEGSHMVDDHVVALPKDNTIVDDQP